MKKLINNPENIVPEMIEGIIASNPSNLAKVLDHNAIYYKKFNKNNVALVSGGGSGHEPAHAGYVGKGMLTGAVLGPVFTSPTPDAILATINACDSKQGTLLIIKNYTGDSINFQLSADFARVEDRTVECVIVDDDISLLGSQSTIGRRGIAGTVYVHKIAGALAQTGASLSEVKDIALKVIKNVASYGVGLDACIIPAVGKKNFNLPEDEAEMGLGIHGEPGIKRVKMQPVDEFVSQIMDEIISYLKLKTSDKVALMINGLGATPLMELYIANRKANKILKSKKIKVVDNIVGNYMTAIDMPGFSISVLKLDDQMAKLLKAKSDTLAFKR